MPIERDIEQFLVHRLKLGGAECYKWTSPGVRGVPDRIVLRAGRIWFVELKRPGAKPRPNQIVVHRRLARQGFDVRVIASKEEAKALAEEVKAWKQSSGVTKNTP